MTLSIVALIGRINVGKSTLFNRLSEKHKAIVSPYPGTTRDLITMEIGWNQTYFQLVDCGGLEEKITDDVGANIQKQTRQLIERANVIVWVIDGKSTMLREDQSIATYLRRLGKPTIVGVNKIDKPRDRKNFDTTLTFGFQTYVLFSAQNGTGTGDLLDSIAAMLPHKHNLLNAHIPRITILGKPNVGKSSLLNALKGQEVRVVSHKPHTTRDSGDIEIHWHKKNFIFTDTAGVRRKSHVGLGFVGTKVTQKLLEEIEHAGIMQSLRHVSDADMIILLLDISQPVSRQDKILGALIATARKPVILAINKWDLIPEKQPSTLNQLAQQYHAQFPHLDFAPLVFISTIQRQHLNTLMKTLEIVLIEKNKTVSKDILRTLLEKFIRKYPPKRSAPAPGALKKSLRITDFFQSGTDPITLELNTPHPKAVPRPWLHLLEKELRKEFGWIGCPIFITPKK
ncbi:MAG: ribosome biogenesis GTPase Der [Candidatus Kerfeldbacteria bacterium RIFCSPHIGHO2_02_FULL_42_14]|uniref:GTPase Der n=1 Tax=Candidatus Kerfeldbacteria bacterium RIFCSPHIGHO2_02_FULL_42_14 TaxID=1798540 RepID=A0A1G2AS30_9BACT|nr:MAG: ribosome biogenesis GTPase Der [Candidatus Kerfeldbacteria bacterium RIFCSPHIGHO2_02_FULL_42_14]OGY81267.1 MAG: ribosome biogenesis GTPase Der [Candidatus Kerfeldbacteria bacterium RIFCSPHIGHO2_12_FULL_42_13]OGY83542.1 MAG: ribosome biogenesis GTPase Der [Candidatus Kerfeldbacteria bacterium RIFCSPLOWO2_02_FULL_42_19]OGY85785.1 MAG: ribosome biogenesis GTPase Der [Candidatus Kerfeldbacteria bacterium RIFCSPLOWO2_12_FULL_43_9]